MAISIVNKDSGELNGANGTTKNTVSITTVTGRLYLLSIINFTFMGGVMPSISNNLGVTWTQVGTTHVSADTGHSHLLYSGVCSAGATGSWTFTAGNPGSSIGYIIDEVSGNDTTSPIVQNVFSESQSSPVTVTLSAFGNTNNGAYATWFVGAQTATIPLTKEGTWTTVKAQFNWTIAATSSMSDYIASNDTTATVTFTPTGAYIGGIAIEIKAATTGGTIAGTGSNVTYGGTAWANPTRITASDTSYSTVSVTNNAVSDYLIGSNFGFNIPTYSTIVGIQITVKGLYSGGLPDWVGVFAGDTATGPAGSGNGITLTTSDSTVTYGDSVTLMTGVTLTPAMVNASTFGVGVIGYAILSGTTNFSIDAIWCQIWYTYNASTCTVKNSIMTLGCGI